MSEPIYDIDGQAPFEESSNMSDSSSGEEVPGPYPPSSSEMSRSDDSSNVASGDENDTIYYMDMGLCGIPENASSSPVCQSLNVLNSPYVCREVSAAAEGCIELIGNHRCKELSP